MFSVSNSLLVCVGAAINGVSTFVTGDGASYRNYNPLEVCLLCILTLRNILFQTDVKWKICIWSLPACLDGFFHRQSEEGGLTLTHPFILGGAIARRSLC